MYGNSVLFELAELLEVFSFPEFLQDTQRKKLEKMKAYAFDIIAWSIVSWLVLPFILAHDSRTLRPTTTHHFPMDTISSRSWQHIETSPYKVQ